MPPMRCLVPFAVLVLVASAAACDLGGPEPPPTVDLAPLEEPMAAVVTSQREADEQLATVLAAVRDLDTSIGGFRDPDTVDDARSGWEAVAETFSQAETDGLRERYLELAATVDEARAVLHGIRQDLDESWERDYLDAEYDALMAVRDYAEESDVLVRALLTHWPTYEAVHDATAEFVEQRWLYRDSAEAADAYELAVSRHLGALEIAQEEIAEGRRVREEAAERANEATQRAREVFEEQPTPQPGEPAALVGS